MDLKISAFKEILSSLLSSSAVWPSLPAGPAVPQEGQEPALLPAQRVGSFGVSSMGMWLDPWPLGPPSARLQAAQQDISVKNREKNNSQIVSCSIRIKKLNAIT
jgi:hypothetical protein